MSGIKEIIIEKSAELFNEAVDIRRHFHKHPELSYQETETSLYICNWLRENNIEFRSGIAARELLPQLKGKRMEVR